MGKNNRIGKRWGGKENSEMKKENCARAGDFFPARIALTKKKIIALEPETDSGRAGYWETGGEQGR